MIKTIIVKSLNSLLGEKNKLSPKKGFSSYEL